MSQAKKGDTVKVHYTGTLEDGTVFDSSSDREPLQFTIGEGKLIPGFENAVVGMGVGESKTERIEADNAYGKHHQELVAIVDKKQLPEDMTPEVGNHLQVHQEDGKVIPVTIIDVSESQVTLDANHPLAGKDLIFQIELIEVV